VDGGRITGLETAQGEVSAGSVVLAGGAESPSLLSKLGLDLPVHPVKGEILTIHATPPPVRSNVWDEDCYLVPKRDGRIIVGATERPGEWDRRPTLGGVAHLSDAARRLIPTLSGAPVVDLWGGLRPGSPSGWPILGPVDGVEGLLLATGHHRNGILLSAVTGDTISALALGEEPAVDPAPFSYEAHMEALK
jgi:glycine oxidase